MDKTYWNQYYERNLAPVAPTQFATDIIDYLKEGRAILDIGCGNGRDSIFFSQRGLKVYAVDQAETAINSLREQYIGSNIKFIADDFVESVRIEDLKYDYLYSRFTIHAITEKQEDKLIKKAFKILKENGLFFIEARSIHDDLYDKGRCVEKNAYIYNDHYRRFINLEELCGKLNNADFEIIYKVEGRDLAIYKAENPSVVRVIAKKP